MNSDKKNPVQKKHMKLKIENIILHVLYDLINLISKLKLIKYQIINKNTDINKLIIIFQNILSNYIHEKIALYLLNH